MTGDIKKLKVKNMITVLDNIIVFLANPLGFLVSILFLLYVEYKVAESIYRDPNAKYVRETVKYLKTYKRHSAVVWQLTVAFISKKAAVSINEFLNIGGITLIGIRKIVHNSHRKKY